MSAQKNERKYWTSLAQLREAQGATAGDEFPAELVMEEMDAPTRRHFLGIMGASMTMASMAGCIRRPTEHIMPYARMPEDVLPGVPSHYATAVNIGADVAGLLVECNDGRPTKIEGNPGHTQNNGGTSGMHQAMVLDLYDPARLRTPRPLSRSTTPPSSSPPTPSAISTVCGSRPPCAAPQRLVPGPTRSWATPPWPRPATAA